MAVQGFLRNLMINDHQYTVTVDSAATQHIFLGKAADSADTVTIETPNGGTFVCFERPEAELITL